MKSASHLKSLNRPLRRAMAEFSARDVQAVLDKLLTESAIVRLSHPLGDMPGAQFYERAYAPLLRASAVVYLASGAAAMVTGTSLMIDDGWTAE